MLIGSPGISSSSSGSMGKSLKKVWRKSCGTCECAWNILFAVELFGQKKKCALWLAVQVKRDEGGWKRILFRYAVNCVVGKVGKLTVVVPGERKMLQSLCCGS